jgi:outer membrane receptor protein involved in Fe transport
MKSKTSLVLLLGTLDVCTPGKVSAAANAPAPNDKDIVELSPFAVTASGNEGYRAVTTLAGTRLKTELRDLGAAISVFTPEFFEDTGATKGTDALSFALNIEVGGVQGNFAGGGVNRSRRDQDSQRSSPQNEQRVRGLSPASLTRNFFLTDIPFDDYNISAVTINRGPNSLLFGIGSPGGVIDASLSRPSLTADAGEVSVRIGERVSNRESFNLNKVIIKDRVGLTLAGLYDEMHYQQKPAFERDKRLYGSVEALVFKNVNSPVLGPTRFRGSYEIGTIVGRPPNVFPPTDSITDWFSPPNPAWQQITGIQFPPWATNGTFVPKFTVNTLPGTDVSRINGSLETPYFINLALYYPGAGAPTLGVPNSPLAGGQGRITYTQNQDRRNRFDLFATNSFAFNLPGFTVPVIMDTNVFDNRHTLMSGTTNRVQRDFDAANVAIEQTLFGGRAGIELAFDVQQYKRKAVLPFSGGGMGLAGMGDIVIDVNQYLANDMPNPNLGRPMMKDTSFGSYSTDRTEREALQATAFYQLDFRQGERMKWLGRHVFTGFYNEQSIDTLGRSYEADWDSETVDLARVFGPGAIAQLAGQRRQIVALAYVGPSLLDPSVRSLRDVRITNSVTAVVPQPGDRHRMFYFDPADRRLKEADFYARYALDSGNHTEQRIDSMAVSWQSSFFAHHLVGLVGWRRDNTETFERVGNDRLPSGEFDPGNLALASRPAFAVEGDTFTWSAVTHVPRKWLERLRFKPDLTLHYNVSENFSPAAGRRDVYGGSLAPPSAKTREYGFTFESPNRKLVLRANWFETSSSLISTEVGGAVGNATSWVGMWMGRWKEAELLGMSINDALALSGPQAVGRFTSYAQIYDAFKGLIPPEIQALRNFRFENNVSRNDPILGQTETTSYVATGMELETVANPTSNWRILLNVGRQQTVRSDTAPALRKLAAIVRENLRTSGLENLRDSPAIGEVETFAVRYARYVLVPLSAELAQDGTVSMEQRKWRVNLVTNYLFTREGWLKGFGVGGALRWQDKVATGYPLLIDAAGVQVPDLSRPFFGPSELNGDAWISYRRKLTQRIGWKVQLNARNAYTQKDYIPMITNPDGSLAVVRNPNPTEFFLTNTFTF